MKHVFELDEQGYSFIPGEFYQSVISSTTNEIDEIKDSFVDLCIDPYSAGNRYRSYTQCKILANKNLEFGRFDPYMQTKKFNPDTGGVVREYPMIERKILGNSSFQALIKSDIDFVTNYKKAGNPNDMQIWIHLFRYKATVNSPAFSSPVWLHKDDEDVVFVHLINSSKNMIGGDNLIAKDVKHIERVIKLENTFDTFVVNHQKYHGVTPVGLKENSKEKFSTRDVILVTFQKMKDV